MRTRPEMPPADFDMSRGNYHDFREAVGQRESGGRYDARNQYGYLGKYQFGVARLADLGLADSGHFLQPLTEHDFLASGGLQDLAFRVHVVKLREDIRKFESGLVGMAHLGGIGNVHKLLTTGEVFKDGNGTPITEYFKLFEGYDL